MRSVRKTTLLSALSAAAAGALAMSVPASAAKYTECQHPVVTGVEVSRLRDVSTATACSAALSLYRWDNEDGHIRRLYTCTGGPASSPVLTLRTLHGWALHVTKAGDFEMSRGRRSFYVSGTDFPLACN